MLSKQMTRPAMKPKIGWYLQKYQRPTLQSRSDGFRWFALQVLTVLISEKSSWMCSINISTLPLSDGDEFQGTSRPSQYLITQKTSSSSPNICVVGDGIPEYYAFAAQIIQYILILKGLSWPIVVKLGAKLPPTKTIGKPPIRSRQK